MDKISHRFKKNNLYLRLLIPYLIISIIIVSVTASISWQLIGSKYNSQIKQSNSHLLGQVQIFADQNLYQNFMLLLNDHFLKGYTNSNLSNFYTQEDKLTHMDYFSFYQNICNISFKNQFIDYITLYRVNSDYLIDSGYGLNMNPEDNHMILQQYLPLKEYKDLAKGSEKLQYKSFRNHNLPRPHLTLMRSIPLYKDFDHSNGFIAITVDEDKFMGAIQQIYQFNGGLFMFDANHNLLLEHMPDDQPFEGNSTDFIKQLTNHLKDAPQFSTMKFHRTEYNITYITSPTSGWQYVSFIPLQTLNAESIAARHLMVVFVILLILLCIVIVQFILSRAYRPIRSLRRQLNDNPEDPKDDISAINEAMIFLEEQVDDMRHTIKDNKQIILYKTLMDLLYNPVTNEEDIHRRLELCQVAFHLPYYCLIIIDVEPTTFYSLSVDQKEYITTKAGEYTEKWFTDQVIQMAECQPANRIVSLLNIHKHHYNRLLEEDKIYLSYLENNLHISINIAISPLIKELSDIHGTFKITADYLKYHFIYGYSNLFSSPAVEMYNKNTLELTLADYRHYKSLLRGGQIKEAKTLLYNYESQLIHDNYSYDSINNFLIHMYRITFNVGKEMNIFQDEEKKEMALEGFKGTTDLKESLAHLQELLDIYQEAYRNRHNSNDTRLIHSIIQYIREHITEELSLSFLADHFNISSSHLSRLFKEITSENLSVYVIGCKLDCAADMIVNEPGKNIATIAEIFGYYTPAYFTKLFKNRFGMTPTQYRKNHSSTPPN